MNYNKPFDKAQKTFSKRLKEIFVESNLEFISVINFQQT